MNDREMKSCFYSNENVNRIVYMYTQKRNETTIECPSCDVRRTLFRVDVALSCIQNMLLYRPIRNRRLHLLLILLEGAIRSLSDKEKTPIGFNKSVVIRSPRGSSPAGGCLRLRSS